MKSPTDRPNHRSDEPTRQPQSTTGSPDGQLIIQAGQLFGDLREIVIEHNGERYRLRITRRGKLILQK